MRWGEIPPAGGIERMRFLQYHGHKATVATSALLERSIAAVESVTGAAVPRWMSSVPPAGHTAVDAHADVDKIVGLVGALAIAGSPTPSRPAEARLLQGEEDARRALRAAVEAHHWLAETDAAEIGHRNLHMAGRYVGLLYGCFHEWDNEDGAWYEVCPVRLAHVPLGQSVGFTSDYICSICGADPSECAHHPDDLHEVVASRTTGHCSVCNSQGQCDHEPGFTYSVHPRAVRTNLQLHEISFVPLPRDPLARINGVEIDAAEAAGKLPGTGWRWRCLACALDCTKYRRG